MGRLRLVGFLILPRLHAGPEGLGKEGLPRCLDWSVGRGRAWGRGTWGPRLVIGSSTSQRVKFLVIAIKE